MMLYSNAIYYYVSSFANVILLPRHIVIRVVCKRSLHFKIVSFSSKDSYKYCVHEIKLLSNIFSFEMNEIYGIDAERFSVEDYCYLVIVLILFGTGDIMFIGMTYYVLVRMHVSRSCFVHDTPRFKYRI